MNITRYVPLGSPLRAAADVLDTLDRTSPEAAAFLDWFNESRYPGGQSLLDYAAMTVEELSEVLPTIPTTAPGLVWKTSAEACLAKTLADANRPFDRLSTDTAEETAALDAIDAFAETLRDASPLLDGVAEVIEQQAPLPTMFYISEIRDARARITDEGIVIGGDGRCEKHEETCYGDDRRVARWDHIETIVPDARQTLTGLLAAFDVFLPEFAEDDNGAARRERARD